MAYYLSSNSSKLAIFDDSMSRHNDINNEQIAYLMALEDNIDKLYQLYGAVRCPCCGSVTIHTYPFYDRRVNACLDCASTQPRPKIANNGLVS